MAARKMQWMIGILASATLAGCATAPSGIVPAGQDAYHVSVFGARYETQTDTNFKALRLAAEYCDKMAKQVMFRQSAETSEHAWSPKQEDLTFVCMDAKDPAFLRAAVEHNPPVVAQQ
jgi:ABC-type xylose transport system substrate-binding protein